MDRRRFLGLAAGTVVSPSLLASPSTPSRGLRAAVLEFEDRWTERSTGAARLLQEAGATVVPLGADRGADRLDVDLVVFGSFVNNGDAYRDWVTAHGASLARFVARGGVVLQMTQSDQYEASVPWLPRTAKVLRGDRDLNVLRPLQPQHPLLAGWAQDGALEFETPGDGPRSWEVVEAWSGCAVLLASESPPQHAAMLESAHGRGRFVISTLWLDKCWRSDGSQFATDSALAAGRGFFAALLRYVELVKSGSAPAVEPTPMAVAGSAGPMVGHIDEAGVWLWYRAAEEAEFGFRVWPADGPADAPRSLTALARATPLNDLCVSVRIEGLAPDTEYRYAILTAGGEKLVDAEDLRFRTAPPADRPSRVALAFGSCARTEPNLVWTRMRDEGCEALVMLGDTPYIDSTNLDRQRIEHRRFLQIPELAALVRQTPVWSTWDDHDFGRNDSDGRLPGKENARRAYVEYRAAPSFGDGEEGIYGSFRYGPVEVFLMDARWFSRTAPSPVDPDRPTLLGETQWRWVLRGLQNSTATFKLLTTGMIWDDKQNSESDDWETYRHEREALFDFVTERRIDGVVLIGGDIHVSRALRYPDRVGYDLWQFISSPMHDSVIPSLNVEHEALVHSAVEKRVFMRLVADTTRSPATLVATWIRADGERLFEVRLDETELRGTN